MSRPLFRGLRPPRAPGELRARVLAACADAASAESADGLLDRLWQSRVARRAWLAAVVVLVLANLAVRRPPLDGGRRGAAPVAASVELRHEIGLSPWWWPGAGGATWAELGAAEGWPGLEID